MLLVAGICVSHHARACTPLRPSVYFLASTAVIREGQEDQIRTLVRMSQQDDLVTMSLLSYTSVDMDAATGKDLAARRLELLVDVLVREGASPAKLRAEAVGPGGIRDTRDPILSNYIQAVPGFLRNGLIVDGCGTILSHQSPELP